MASSYRLEELDHYKLYKYRPQILPFIREVAACFNHEFDYMAFNISEYVLNQDNRIVIAWKGEKLVGCYLARISENVFDPSRTFFYQDLLYVREGHPRAARLLFLDMIDFGKTVASSVVTSVSENTRLSERSLYRHGFRKYETTYILENKDE